MNSKLIVSALLLLNNVSTAHHIPAVDSIHYNIHDANSQYSQALYDITHGTVQYTEANGTRKRYTRAHMARVAPWNAQEILGKITVDLANELAGTWYIYK